ncbi:MAG: ATP-binding protein [Candidatus Bathyarchaeota archaeon]|nr:MAG: ATP-binding protein [Candidatus Bathyarchaeota archaeon]
MRIGYSFSVTGDYPQDSLTIILEDGCEVAKGDLVYVEHPKKGSPVIYQITKVCSHKETRDYEEALLKGGSVITDEERTTVRARAYQWGWMDGENIRPLRYPLPPNTQVFNAPPNIIEEFTQPASKWKIPLGVDPSSGLNVELDLYYLIRQCCLICGAVGTGKTTTAISMITRAAQAEPPVKFLIIDKDGEYSSLEMILGEKVEKIPWLSFFRSDDIHPEDLISEFRWQRGWWTSKILMKALSFLENVRQPLTKPHLTEAVKGVSEESVGFRRSEEDFDNYKRQAIEAVRFSRTIPNEYVKALDPVDLLNRHRIVIMDLSWGPNGWAKKHLVLTQVLRRVFHEALENSSFGCVIVLEEAMYYAPQWTQFSTGSKDSRGRLLSIVKEIATNGGRNGVGLWVVTQRLATVDKTVITQCANNTISHALEDIDKKRLQEVVGEHFVELLGSLPQGEAIMKGTALKCKFPIWVKVKPEMRPASAKSPPILRFQAMAAKEKELAQEIIVR